MRIKHGHTHAKPVSYQNNTLSTITISNYSQNKLLSQQRCHPQYTQFSSRPKRPCTQSEHSSVPAQNVPVPSQSTVQFPPKMSLYSIRAQFSTRPKCPCNQSDYSSVPAQNVHLPNQSTVQFPTKMSL